MIMIKTKNPLTYKIYPAEKDKERKRCRKWYIQVNLGAVSKDGKFVYPKKRKTFKGTYREAELAGQEYKEMLEEEMRNYGRIANSRCFLSSYCNEFYNLKCSRDDLSGKSLGRLKHALDNLLLNHDDVVLKQVTPSSLTTALIKLKEGHSVSGKKLSPATCAKYLMYWRQMFNQAVDDGLIDANPADRVKPIKIPKPNKKALTLEQAHDLFLQLDPKNRSEIGAIISLYCGLRQSEVLNLKWKDIDLEKQKLTVRKSKTNAGVRTIPIINEVVDSLNARKQQVLQELVSYNSKQSNEAQKIDFNNDFYVCSGILGNVKSEEAMLTQWWQRNRDRLGCNGFSFHELRHTFATLLAKADVHPSVMQKFLGHSTSRMSLEVYTHVHQEDLEEAEKKLQAMIK